MNPRPTDELRRLRANLDKLAAAIRHANEEAEQAKIEREKLLQEQWRLQRETATHRRAAQDYDALLSEHEALQTTAADVKETLHGILDWAKTARSQIER